MTTSVDELKSKRCRPCEGGVPRIAAIEATRLLEELPGWELSDDGERIERRWTVQDFSAGMAFLEKVAELAEDEGHHPDIHLTGYRNVAVELTTHAIGGLSENDFILAAKIDELPVALKRT